MIPQSTSNWIQLRSGFRTAKSAKTAGPNLRRQTDEHSTGAHQIKWTRPSWKKRFYFNAPFCDLLVSFWFAYRASSSRWDFTCPICTWLVKYSLYSLSSQVRVTFVKLFVQCSACSTSWNVQRNGLLVDLCRRNMHGNWKDRLRFHLGSSTGTIWAYLHYNSSNNWTRNKSVNLITTHTFR